MSFNYCYVAATLLGACACHAGDLALLAYGHNDQSSGKIEALEVSKARVLALPKVLDNPSMKLSADTLIKAAQKVFTDAQGIHSNFTREWFYPAKETTEFKPNDPFGSDPAPMLTELSWQLLEATMREIDLGRDRSTPLSWRSEPSGRLWWEVKLRGHDKAGQSVGHLTIFLLQDMSVITPSLVEPTDQEKKMGRR